MRNRWPLQRIEVSTGGSAWRRPTCYSRRHSELSKGEEEGRECEDKKIPQPGKLPDLRCESRLARRRYALGDDVAIRHFSDQRQLLRQLGSERAMAEPPDPIAARLAGNVHARFAIESQ